MTRKNWWVPAARAVAWLAADAVGAAVQGVADALRDRRRARRRSKPKRQS